MSEASRGADRDFNAGAEVDALGLSVPLEPVPAEQVQDAAPAAGAVALGEFDGREVGVWEHTVGVSTDVEAEELFVVLSGAGSVEFVDEGRIVQLRPGTVLRLSEGQRTIWTVTETLRKVYVS